MKLRNKKTGSIWNVWSFYDENQTINLKYFNNDGVVNLEYNSLAELNKEWEDYKPAEPLIKDPKIRKVVRAWAELVHSSELRYSKFDGRFYTVSGYIVSYSISFPVQLQLSEKTNYTITELCGDEDEEDY